MKKIVALLLVLLMVVSLAACSKPQQPSTPDPQKTDAPASESTSTDAQNTEESKDLEGEITFWHSFTQGPRMEKIQAAADAFMAEHPKVKITIETFSWADFYTKWTTGLASGNVPDISSTVASQLVEMIVFLGLISMVDPPRPESVRAVAEAKQAGIKTVMITGDHVVTASAIARELGIMKDGDRALTGAEVDAMTDSELDSQVEHIAVYARVSPENKIRIVKSWQRKGQVVAMTGDGVPSLNSAYSNTGVK